MEAQAREPVPKATGADLHGAGAGAKDRGWREVDLDGTLAQYDGWKGPTHIGGPVPVMLERVLAWMKAGEEVRIVTARVFPGKEDAEVCRKAIAAWLEEHVYAKLPEPEAGKTWWIPVTHEKDHRMVELWDDRCVQVIPNTGIRVDQRRPELDEIQAALASHIAEKPELRMLFLKAIAGALAQPVSPQLWTPNGMVTGQGPALDPNVRAVNLDPNIIQAARVMRTLFGV